MIRLRSMLLGLLLLLSFSALPRQQASADDVEQRVADFWRRVDALGPSDALTAADLGQWALNITQRDPGAGITLADFRASTAAMQEAFDRAGVGIPPGTPRSPDVEGRIARFWQTLDALGPGDVVTAADLGQWALNVTDRDPNKRIRVDDFRASTGGMQGGLERARSLPRPAAPVTVTPTPMPARATPTPSPTPRTALTYRSALLGRSPDPAIPVGDVAILTLTFRNDGTATWKKGTSSAVYLWTGRGVQFPVDMKEGWTSAEIIAYPSESEVGPEGTATFTFRVKGTVGGEFALSIVPTSDATGEPTALQSVVSITVTVGAIPTPSPTSASATPAPATPAPATNAPGATPTPTPTPTQAAADDGGTIREGETTTAECGSGDSGTRVEFVGGNYTGMFGYNLRRTVGGDGSVQITAMVSDPYSGAPRRGPVMWKLSRGFGGVLSVQGCTATFSGATSYGTAMVLIFPAEVVSTPVVPSEGGPRNAAGQLAHLVVPNPNAARAPRAACGAEWLQVSITGPYSYSTNWFWIRRAGNVLWWGPFANNGTFNLAPGTYQISIAFAGVPGFSNDTVNIPSCGSQRYIRSNQGWGG